MLLRDLRENPNNPSKASEEELNRLAGKLKRVPLGLTAMRIAYVTDDPAGGKMVISGNKRLRVLKRAYGDDAELPDEYFQDVTGMSEAERHEFIVTANVSDGHWDLDKLLGQYDTSELRELMSVEEVTQILRDKNHKELKDADPEKLPEEEQIIRSEFGKIYKLGNHRLICGDSTKRETFDKLMQGKQADIVVTDPPYNINVQGGTRQKLKIKNDNMSSDKFFNFLVDVYQNIEYVLKPGGVFYVWMVDGGPDGDFEMALRETNLHQSIPLIWVKNVHTFSMGRLDYNRKHECCKYGWKEGAKHFFSEEKNLNTLIQDDTPDFDKIKKEDAISLLKQIYDNDIQSSVIHENKPTRNHLHPTMKPVKLIKRQIENSSLEGDIVVDLFLGSGTTILAAEETNRICYGVEFDPHYCDVIRKRYAEYKFGEGCDWQKLTPEDDK